MLELTPNTWHLVEIWTDHKNLEYFMTAKKLNCHQAHRSLYLARFNFKLIYCPGCSMGKPNTLSQRPDHSNRAFDNEDVVLLRPELIAVWALEGLYLEGPEQDMLREICQGNQKDDQEEPVVKAARELWQASSKIVCSCHKLHSAISLSILHRFSRSQWQRKALEKTFWSVPVTSRGNQ